DRRVTRSDGRFTYVDDLYCCDGSVVPTGAGLESLAHDRRRRDRACDRGDVTGDPAPAAKESAPGRIVWREGFGLTATRRHVAQNTFTSYASNTSSLLIKETPSTRACATSMRSKGSRWCCGSSADSMAWSWVIGSGLTRVAAARLATNSRTEHGSR